MGKTKALFYCLSVCLLVVGIIWGGSILMEKIYQDERDRVIREAGVACDAFTQHTIQLVSQVDAILRAVRMFYARTDSVGETQQFVDKLNFDKSVIGNIYLISPDGRIIFSHDQEGNSRDVSERDYFRYHRETPGDRLFISAVEPGRLTGKYHFRISRRISNPDGSFAGIVIATIDPQSFARYYGELKIGPQNLAALLGIHDRKFRARIPEPSAEEWSKPLKSPLWDMLGRSENGSFDSLSPVDNIQRIYQYRTVGDLPLVIVVGFSDADVRRRVSERKNSLFQAETIVIIFLLTIFAELITVLISRDKLSAAKKSLETYNLALSQEVRRRKEIEQSLLKSEETLRGILSTSPVGIGMSQDRIMKWANEAWLKMFGFDGLDECAGKSTRIIYRSDDEFERVGKALYTNLAKGLITRTDAKFLRKDGSEFDAHISMQILTLPGNEKVSIAAVADISDRKRAEEALKKERNLAQMYLDIAGVMLVALNAEGKVVLINRKGCEILGYKTDEITNCNWFDTCIPAELRAEIKGVFDKLMAGEIAPVENYENPVLTKDGECRVIDFHNTVLRDSLGEIVGIFFSGEDITDRNQARNEREALRAQLLQSQKMEAVGTLAAGIAHDFNNMLQVILGYSDLLLGSKNEGEPGRRELEKIAKTALQARDLVQKIRIFSRKADIELAPVDLNQRISELVGLLAHTLPKTIEIDARLADNLGIIKADPALIDQMVMNSAFNASDAMPDGGTLTIQTQNALLDDEFCRSNAGLEPGPHVSLAVSDTGKGMSRELLDKIFDPFFSTKQRDYHRGTGLGLSIVQGIVDEHGGKIMVESVIGKGTTFRIYFPAMTPGQLPKHKPVFAASAPGPETILLVEDEELVRNFGVSVFERFGYKVLAASDGQEALEVYGSEGQNISLVILDIVMPRMGGKECLQGLLKINPEVKVIISSGVAQEDLIKDVVYLGAKGFLLKPYGVETLLDKVREVLGGV